jgi:hypothetical protein
VAGVSRDDPLRRIALPLDNADLGALHAFLRESSWYVRPRTPGRLEPGSLAGRGLTIPQRDAQQVLRQVARLVADIPRDSSPDVVWQAGGSELWVDTGSLRLACAPGLVTIAVTVACDQAERTSIPVAFGTGSTDVSAGLVMSALTELAGPRVITDHWSEAITAFAWETLLEAARRLCANLGSDARGKALVPGSIASGRGVLIVQPVSRHERIALDEFVR